MKRGPGFAERAFGRVFNLEILRDARTCRKSRELYGVIDRFLGHSAVGGPLAASYRQHPWTVAFDHVVAGKPCSVSRRGRTNKRPDPGENAADVRPRRR